MISRGALQIKKLCNLNIFVSFLIFILNDVQRRRYNLFFTKKLNDTLREKIKYFMLESSIFGVKTSPSKKNKEPENKMHLSSTNGQDRKY